MADVIRKSRQIFNERFDGAFNICHSVLNRDFDEKIYVKLKIYESRGHEREYVIAEATKADTQDTQVYIRLSTITSVYRPFILPNLR